MIIEILGLDGAGKTTVSKSLAAALGGRARKVRAYSPDFEYAASLVRGRFGIRAERALRGCAVASALIRESALANDGVDVFDRYVEAARMYFSVQEVQPLTESILESLPQPDLVLLLDVDVQTAMARQVGSTFADREEEIVYLNACASYLQSASVIRGWVVVDAREDIEKVIATALEAARRALGIDAEVR